MKATLQILLLFIFFLLVADSGYTQSGALEWAKQANGTLNDNVSGIALDNSGNILLTGDFRGTITFGAGEVNETTLYGGYGLGDYDIFVAKYMPNGALQWAKMEDGSSFSYGRDIATDDSGNILVTGTFSDTATFGGGEVNETILASAGKYDIYVAKYTPNSNLLWVKKAGGPDYDYARGIADDGSGNILVTGYFSETMTFDTGEVNETILTSPGHEDIFVAKYAPSGDLLWVKNPGGPSKERSSDITSDDSGNILVSGVFKKTATFGSGEANETTFTSAGLFDVYLAKYAPSGDLLWVKKAGGTEEDALTAVATDGSGSVLGAGIFRGTAVFGEGEINETVLISDGEMDFFISKYTPDGDLLWVKRMEEGINWSDGYPSAVAADESGNIFMTGQFRDKIRFGEGEVNETILISDDNLDVFLAGYAPSGDLLWAKKAGGPNFEYCGGMAIDDFGNILVAGDFSETLAFGVGETNETILTSSGFSDIFFAKFSGNMTGIAEPSNATPIPEAFSLEQNYPNPFNPTTTISFDLSRADYVDLIIYNVRGQVVRTLFAGDLEAGTYQFRWDSKGDNGNQITSGIYFYKLRGENYEETRKLILVQ